MNVFDSSGRHVVVIGAGGMGWAIAQGLAIQGAHVAVADADHERAAQVAAELRRPDACALAAKVDTTSE